MDKIAMQLKSNGLKVCRHLDCRYAASIDGRIFSLFSSRGVRKELKEVKLILDHQGYLRAIFYLDNKKYYSTKAHRVVASCFLGLDLMDKNWTVHHKNGNKTDNNVSNLEIIDRRGHCKVTMNNYNKNAVRRFTVKQKKILSEI